METPNPETIILEPALSDAAQPDLIMHITENPSSEPLIYSSLVDASRLVKFLSGFGGKEFTWRYPKGEDGVLRHYTVTVDLTFPMSKARMEEIGTTVRNEFGGIVLLLSPDLVEVWDRDAHALVRETRMVLVMEFPIVVGM